jgi:hypothetical protein
MSSGRKRNRNGNFTSDSPPSTTAPTLTEDFVRRVCNFSFFSLQFVFAGSRGGFKKIYDFLA